MIDTPYFFETEILLLRQNSGVRIQNGLRPAALTEVKQRGLLLKGEADANAEHLVEKGVSPMSDCAKPKGLKTQKRSTERSRRSPKFDRIPA